MKKLRLDVEALAVETFGIAREVDVAASVRAHEASLFIADHTCADCGKIQDTLPPVYSCGYTYDYHCESTAAGTATLCETEYYLERTRKCGDSEGCSTHRAQPEEEW